MSHFTKVKTNILDKDLLVYTLKEMNYNVIEGKPYLKGFEKQNQKVDLLVKLESSYDIGFKKNNEGVYTIIADWWGVQGINKEKFIRDIKQHYSLNMINREMRKKGYKIVEQKNVEGNAIKVILRKW